MLIRLMEINDLDSAAQIHKVAFVRQQNSYQWIRCSFNAAPRILSFVVLIDEQIIGYIIWGQKSGFRKEVVLELEQLAVDQNHRGQGVGRQLILESLSLVKKHLKQNHATIKHIMVTTRADNAAQKLYRETLGVEIETTIANLYSADEVLMIARNINN